MSKEEILARFNKSSEHTLMQTLEIEYTDLDIETGMLEAKMPVNSRVHQPMGLLHGGANAVLAESLGSAASVMFIDREKSAVLGIEISCNHVRSKKDGYVVGTATIIHKGRSTHLWEIRICDEEGRLLSHCKLTNMIVPLRKTQ